MKKWLPFYSSQADWSLAGRTADNTENTDGISVEIVVVGNIPNYLRSLRHLRFFVWMSFREDVK
jgi:hypothetical protein